MLLIFAIFAYTAPKLIHLILNNPTFQTYTNYHPSQHPILHNILCSFIPALALLTYLLFPQPTTSTPSPAPASRFPPGMQIDVVQKTRERKRVGTPAQDEERVQYLSINGLRVRPENAEAVRSFI